MKITEWFSKIAAWFKKEFKSEDKTEVSTMSDLPITNQVIDPAPTAAPVAAVAVVESTTDAVFDKLKDLLITFGHEIGEEYDFLVSAAKASK